MSYVTAAVAIGGTLYSAYQSNKQSKIAAKGNVFGSKIKPPAFPDYNPNQGAKDFETSLPSLTNIAGQVTDTNIGLRNRVMPQSSDIMSRGGGALQALLHGEVPQDVVDQTNRRVAERAGGNFDPTSPNFAGGGSVTTNNFARNIGLTSEQMMEKGLSMAPAWESMADSFIYKPEQALGGAMQFLNARLGWSEDKYTADLNAAKLKAGADPNAVGQMNLGVARNMLGANTTAGNMSLLNSIPALSKQVGNAYNQAYSGVSGQPMDSGFYGSESAARAAGGGAPVANQEGQGWYIAA